jgi:MFS family permease
VPRRGSGPSTKPTLHAPIDERRRRDFGVTGPAGPPDLVQGERSSRTTVAALFHHPGFRALFIGQSVSALGDWMITIALMALALELSDSSLAVATILVLRLAPAALAGPLTAKIVSSWDRRRTMLAADLARCGVVIAIPLVHQLWWVYVWAFVLEACGLVFLPARDASIPDLAGEDDLPLANGLMLGSSYGTIPLGAALFGGIAALVGGRHGSVPAMVFFIDAATFLVSFALIWGLHELEGNQGTDATGDVDDGDDTGTIRFRDALRLPIIRSVGTPTIIIALGLGTLFSVGILFIQQVLHASDSQFSWLVALFGVGAAVGLAILHLGRLKGVRVVRFGVMAQGIVIAGMSLSPTVYIAFIGAVLFGAATAATLAAAMSVLQEELGDRRRIMAFSVFHVFIRGGLALAALAAGAGTDAIRGVHWPVLGHLPPARLVLLLAGVVVFLGGTMSHLPGRVRHAEQVAAEEQEQQEASEDGADGSSEALTGG